MRSTLWPTMQPRPKPPFASFAHKGACPFACPKGSFATRAIRRSSGKTRCDLRLYWWALLGSNQWPLPCEGSALPLS
jgi:hypothetical protein